MSSWYECVNRVRVRVDSDSSGTQTRCVLIMASLAFLTFRQARRAIRPEIILLIILITRAR